MDVHCFATHKPKQALEPFSYTEEPLPENAVTIKISHCGICHSDIHLIDNDWGISKYPLVPGHEIIGTITETGKNVTHLKVGQRVGVGWQYDSCGKCEWCQRGEENQCPKQKATCVDHFGGFSETISVPEHFVFEIPENIPSENAAPLLCGGITVFSPLNQYVYEPKLRVGIIGIGGLGHLALQFAHALECDVTAFSSTNNKETEAKKLGADHFQINDTRSLKKLKSSFDFILSTVPAALDWTTVVNMLRPFGKLCVVGGPEQQISLPIMSLIEGRKTLCGSNIGSCQDIRNMLDFASRYKIHAQVETLPMNRVNDALDKVRQNQARYRMVLEA